MRAKLIILFGVLVMLAIAVYSIIATYKDKEDSRTAAVKIGDGNLKVVTIGRDKLLVNETQDLTLYTGERMRGFRSTDAYAAAGKSFKLVPSELIALESNGSKTELNCLIAINNVVSCDEGTQMSPDHSRIIVGIAEGIWILDAKGNRLRNFAKDKPVQDEQLAGDTSRASGTNTNDGDQYELRWAMNPMWVSNDVIAFSSNRDVYPYRMASSIWTMDIETKEVTKRIDAIDASDELNVLYADEERIIAWGGVSGNVYRYTFQSGTIDTYTIKGVPFSVSNNGQIVLYKQLDDTTTQLPAMSILNVEDGSISQVEHQSDHQIGNGAWDEQNRYFAFFSHSFKEVGAQLYLLDLGSQMIEQVQVPDETGILDPAGSISWLDKHTLIMAAEQGTWKVPLGERVK